MEELQMVSPESLGIPSGNFLEFYRQLAINKLPLHHFIFLRHGRIASMGSWYPYTSQMNHIMYSTSKTITSLAIGLCVDEGLLDLDCHIVDFFPELITGPLHPYNKMRTIRHLLTMQGGETGDASSIDRSYPNWLKSYLNTPPRVKPGTLYGYDNSGTHTLAAIVQKVTGKKMVEYLNEKLFVHMGITGVYWEEQMGINTGSRGFHCKIQDIAKIALLIHQKGMWDGKRIISNEWLEEAIRSHVEVTHFTSYVDGNPGYGYQFWRYRNGAYGSKGHGGQMFIICPDTDIIWAFQGNLEDGYGHLTEVMHLAWPLLFKNISDTPLPENRQILGHLREMENGLQMPMPKGLREPSRREGTIVGKTYEVAKNSSQIHSMAINQIDNGLKFIFTLGINNDRWEIEAWYNDWKEQEITVTQDYGWARYVWRNEHVMECIILLREKLGSYHLIIYADDDNGLSIDLYPVGWRDFNRLSLFGMAYCREGNIEDI